jgi:hypothetical protein
MVRTDVYLSGLFWIIRERGGPNGGWPPHDIGRVSGWKVVQLLAHLTNRSARQVAGDLIEHSTHMEKLDEWVVEEGHVIK